MSIQNIFLAAPSGTMYINPDSIGSVQIQHEDLQDNHSPYVYVLAALTPNATIYISTATFPTPEDAFNAIAAILVSAMALNSQPIIGPQLVNLT